MKLSSDIQYLFLLVCLVAVGCEREPDNSIIISKADPFATCYVTNTSKSIRLYLKKAKQIGETYDYQNDPYHHSLNITDAIVTINDDNQKYQMFYDTNTYSYSIDTSIIPVIK